MSDLFVLAAKLLTKNDTNAEVEVRLRDISRRIIICTLVIDILLFAVYVWTFVFTFYYLDYDQAF